MSSQTVDAMIPFFGGIKSHCVVVKKQNYKNCVFV